MNKNYFSLHVAQNFNSSQLLKSSLSTTAPWHKHHNAKSHIWTCNKTQPHCTQPKPMGLVVWDHPWNYRAHWPHPRGQRQSAQPERRQLLPWKTPDPGGLGQWQINWWQGYRSAVPGLVSVHATLLSAMQTCQRWECYCNNTESSSARCRPVQNGPRANPTLVLT